MNVQGANCVPIVFTVLLKKLRALEVIEENFNQYHLNTSPDF